MKNKQAKDYLYTHNLSRLLNEANAALTVEQVDFYVDINKFQAEGRYPETLNTIETTTTLSIYNYYNALLKQERIWLKKQLQ